MRLRYLHLPDHPPLKDVAITFGYDPVLDRVCAIHFIVGINGSGKSRLLRALAEAFLHLSRRSIPSFSVTVAYDIGMGDTGHTIYFYRGENSADTLFIPFEQVLPKDTEWEAFASWKWDTLPHPYPISENRPYRGGELPGSGSINYYLPKVLLAYTSGITDDWESLFSPRPQIVEELLSAEYDSPEQEQERPTLWDTARERDYLRREGEPTPIQLTTSFQTGELNVGEEEPGLPDIGMYVPPRALKLAFCSVALKQAEEEFAEIRNLQEEEGFIARINANLQGGERMDGLRGILNEVDWLWPVTIRLRVALDPQKVYSRLRIQQLRDLYSIVTSVVSEPNPSMGRNLFFDLRRILPNRGTGFVSTASALVRAIAGENAPAFSIFEQLMDWIREGLLEDISLAFRKRNVESLLLYDWLSDGEKAFLGRMAIFHLLKGTNDALILLDEPETHFNDVWKREIIDIIDSNLQNDANEVVISTHSSIALSDVFAEEIELLHKIRETSQIVARRLTAPTFGADPSEIMIQVFGAPDSIGKRSLEYLERQLQRSWRPEERVRLESIIREIGPGYHRSELRIIWRNLIATQN